jgi:hypothetical protein
MPVNTKRTIPKGKEGLLPNGVYRVIIEHAEEKDGPSGHPYYNFRLRAIVKGEKHPISIWDKVSHSPDARFRMENLMDAIEFEEGLEVDAPDFIGKSYWASISSRQYQGKWSNEVKDYLTPEAAEIALQKKAESDGFSPDVETVSTERNKRPVEGAVAASGKRSKANVSELAGENSPF